MVFTFVMHVSMHTRTGLPRILKIFRLIKPQTTLSQAPTTQTQFISATLIVQLTILQENTATTKYIT